MEKCERKVNSFAVTRSVYLMGLFDWKLVEEVKKENGPSLLRFERDETVPYYQEMVEVEKEISPKLIPFWTLLIPVGIAFITMTVFLILFLTLRSTYDMKSWFFFFFIPSSLLLLLDTGLFFIRSKQLINYLNKEEELVKAAEEKMKALREKYRNQ